MARPARWLAAALGLAAAAARGTPGDRSLEIENEARGATFRLPVGSGEAFSVTSQHSMYDAPVTEEFVIGADGRIVLVAVSSPSAAVREYFGLTAAGERHAMERSMDEVVFRVAAGAPQRLRAGGVERSFLELGEHGDRLVMRAALPPSASGAAGRGPAGPGPGDRAPAVAH